MSPPPRCPLQVLTVAATEPLTLLRSVPPHPTAPPHRGEEAPGDPAAPPQPPDPPGGFAVDFQRVYEYLGRLCRGGKGPAPPPAGEWGIPVVGEWWERGDLGLPV